MKYIIPIICLFGANQLEEKPVMKESVQEDKRLTLYVSKRCRYCKKVLTYMKEHHINLVVKDIGEEGNKEFLIRKGKKGQVPCLFIGEKPMYESDEIIDYLKAHQ